VVMPPSQGALWMQAASRLLYLCYAMVRMMARVGQHGRLVTSLIVVVAPSQGALWMQAASRL
jgi:hypothetical protein